MALKDITQPFPSEYMIKRSKRMKVEKVGDDWEVWEINYDEAHKVVKQIHFYTCDCIGYQMHGMCSHVAAVKISQAPQDRKDLFGDK